MSDPYYILDTALFEGVFRYFGKEQVQVRGKVHQSEEQYSLRQAEREIEPITTLRGTRVYVHMKPFVLLPEITLTGGLFSEQRGDQAIGEVLASREGKKREVGIGQVQAWYYPQDTTIMLWECFLNDFVRERPLLEDPNMRALWENFVRFLQEQWSEATRIATPSHDPLFGFEEYQAFLRSLGYEQVAKAAYGKALQ